MQQGSMKGSGWAAVHHFSFSPDSWVQKTDSLSLSTKLINSLLERPDKPLINWLHWPPPPLVQLAAKVPQAPTPGQVSTRAGPFPTRDPQWGSRAFCSPGGLGHSDPNGASLPLPPGTPSTGWGSVV